MFCGKCGAKIRDDSKFCPNCGAPVMKAPAAAPAGEPEGDREERSVAAVVPDAGASGAGGEEDAGQAASQATGAQETGAQAADGQEQGTVQPGSQEAAPAAAGSGGKAAGTDSDGKAARKFLSNKRDIGALIGVIALIVVAIIVYVNASGALVLGQRPDKFKAAFQNDSIVVDGLANSYYVNDSPYEVTSFNCSDIRKVSSYEVDANITATIENDNFTTEISAIGAYYDFSKADSDDAAYARWLGVSGYYFEVVDSTTTPKKGIDYDTDNGLENVDATLSDDATSCTVTTSDENSFWFADSAIDKTYTYTFDGTSWSFADMQENDAITYKADIEGDYAPKSDGDRLPKFTISNLDTEKGTFQIDYEIATTYTNGDAYSTSGTINATIEQRDSGSYYLDSDSLQADGKAYYFEGTGNSDSGDGQAEVSGYFITDNGGEPALQVYLDADYQFEFHSWRESRTMYFNDGTVFKQ